MQVSLPPLMTGVAKTKNQKPKPKQKISTVGWVRERTKTHPAKFMFSSGQGSYFFYAFPPNPSVCLSSGENAPGPFQDSFPPLLVGELE